MTKNISEEDKKGRHPEGVHRPRGPRCHDGLVDPSAVRLGERVESWRCPPAKRPCVLHLPSLTAVLPLPSSPSCAPYARNDMPESSRTHELHITIAALIVPAPVDHPPTNSPAKDCAILGGAILTHRPDLCKRQGDTRHSSIRCGACHRTRLSPWLSTATSHPPDVEAPLRAAAAKVTQVQHILYEVRGFGSDTTRVRSSKSTIHCHSLSCCCISFRCYHSDCHACLTSTLLAEPPDHKKRNLAVARSLGKASSLALGSKPSCAIHKSQKHLMLLT